MSIYYYLTVFPMEAMIASQLEPEAFGAYMAIGNRKGSAEKLIFFEISEEAAADSFDIEYAKRRCVPHSNGKIKNSVYLSVYRALEALSTEQIGNLWLTTVDGRSICLNKTEYKTPEPWGGTALYQELCPTHPLVISALSPKYFAEYIMEDSNKVRMPAIVFVDLAMPNLEDQELTGNIGGYFEKIIVHLKYCLDNLKAGKGKQSKIVNRSASAHFTYQVIGRGFYVGSGQRKISFYPMPDKEELKKKHYDWAKSALIF